MKNESAITYREFHEVPRVFLTQYEGRQFLCESLFDDDLDDYSPMFTVNAVPPLSGEQLAGSRANLTDLALERLGEVPVKDVVFDPTRRRAIDMGVLDSLLSSREAVAT